MRPRVHRRQSGFIEGEHPVDDAIQREVPEEALSRHCARSRAEAGSSRTRRIPRARLAGSCEGTSTAVSSSTNSRIAGNDVATIGTSSAIASSTAPGDPSRRDGATKTSAAHISSNTSSRRPRKSTAGSSACPPRRSRGAARSARPSRPAITNLTVGLLGENLRDGAKEHVESLRVLVTCSGEDHGYPRGRCRGRVERVPAAPRCVLRVRGGRDPWG